MQETEQVKPRITYIGHGESALSVPPQTPQVIQVLLQGKMIESFKRSLASSGLKLAGPLPAQMGGDSTGTPTYVVTVSDEQKRRNGL